MAKNKKNKPLGIGLEALIPNYQTDSSNENYIDHIDVDLISPNSNQPRQIFSDQNMSDLVESIRENGILQPLLVRPLEDGSYELIAGERRFRSAIELKMDRVPVYILDVKSDDEMLKLALIENIQRDNLSSIEEAEGYALLKGKYSFSESDLAKKIGKNRSTIANKLRLIKLPYTFLITTIALFLTKFFNGKKELNIYIVLIMGIFQILALFPGISRSGITISTLLILGVNKEDAIKFSFIIAIPLILGAALLNGDFSLSIISFLGVFVSFIFGWFAIYLSNILLSNKKYWMFSIYCF